MASCTRMCIARAPVATCTRLPGRRPLLAAAHPPRPHHLTVAFSGVGQDAVGSWVDLAGFVTSSGGGAKTPYDGLADKIGRDAYLDVAGWKLYLRDVKLTPGGTLTLAQGLAAKLGPVFDGQGFRESDVVALIGQVPLRLGGGKATLPLAELMPAACVRDLLRVCEDYCRDL